MDWLKCNICFNPYNDSILRPRSLSCGHTFCEKCLNNTIQNENLTCPQCRKIHEINSALDLPINFTLEGLLKSLNVCSQSVTEGAASNHTERETNTDDKSETQGSLKSLLDQQEISLSAQKELLKTSAGLCYEHPSKECLFRCSKHMCWVCEQCIEEQGVHPKHKCKITLFKEEIEDRKEDHKMSLEKYVNSCDDTLDFIEKYVSNLRDERQRHMSLIDTLQVLVNKHNKEEKNLENEMICFQKLIEEGKNVKQKVLDNETIILNVATLDESNTARDIVKSKNAEVNNWIDPTYIEVIESKQKIEKSKSTAMATEMALEYREKCLMLHQELEKNIINSGQTVELVNKIKPCDIKFMRKFDDFMTLILRPPVVYLTLTHNGTILGQLHIKLDMRSYPRRVQQFVKLATGRDTCGSYKGARFGSVGNKGFHGEWLGCDGHNNATGATNDELEIPSKVPRLITVGNVYGRDTKDSSFYICTKSFLPESIHTKNPIYGQLIYGLPLLKDVIQKYSGNKVDSFCIAIDIKIHECGVIFDSTE